MSQVSPGFHHLRCAPAGQEGRVPPAETIVADIRCVTRWSKLAPNGGVPDRLVVLPAPGAAIAVAR
jgi:hypothetical protein